MAALPTSARAQEHAVTFNQQVAPILYKNCSGCHHTGGAGPFSLLSYADAKRWALLIRTVTASRYMPPWLPEPGFGDFAENRRLTDADIATIKAWVDSGMPEGKAGDAPKPPVFSKDWQLGQPDLIVKVELPMTVPGQGSDLFRNFILPVPIEKTQYVRAMEIRPGTPRVVHHANVLIDRTASLRRAHPGDWKQGVPGMELTLDAGDSFDPDSHFLFWKPDSAALVEPEGMPWRLDPGNDLILNMHLKPTGKEETVQASIGLYFTDKPPTAHPILLQLEHDDALDIAANEANFVVEDELTLPVDVDVLGVYPHAHYLGKTMEGYALLPNGEKKWLVLIRDWDINRQSVYRFQKPLFLPKGSVLHMRYTYDNSKANVRNPSNPPVRVKGGNRSVDEMGHLWLQVLPRAAPGGDEDPRVTIERSWMENRLRKDPQDYTALYNLASMEMIRGKYAGASDLFRRALEQKPSDVRGLTAYGTALDKAGDWQQAKAEFEKALAADAENRYARYDLAQLELQHGKLSEAEGNFRRLLADNPGDGEAHAQLGAILAATNRGGEGQKELEAALAIDANSFNALFNLASVEAQQGNLSGAASLLERALKQKDDAEAHQLLGNVYAAQGGYEIALEQFRTVAKLQPNDPAAHFQLAQILVQIDQVGEGIREQLAGLALSGTNADDWNYLGELYVRTKQMDEARKAFERALELNPQHALARTNLSHL
jgi:Flp pilus assembly protein TadD